MFDGTRKHPEKKALFRMFFHSVMPLSGGFEFAVGDGVPVGILLSDRQGAASSRRSAGGVQILIQLLLR